MDKFVDGTRRVDGQLMDILMDKFVDGEGMGGWTIDDHFEGKIDGTRCIF